MHLGRITILLLIINSAYGQDLKKFEFTDCLKKQQGDSSKLLNLSTTGGQTTIEFITYSPCNGNFIGDFELKNEYQLNLVFKPKPIKFSNEEEMIDIADCNCLFKFKFIIENLTDVNAELLTFNNKTLEQIDKENIWTEIKIED